MNKATTMLPRKKMTERMVPARFVSMDGFLKRSLRSGEALSLYLYELKRLLDQAMPGLDATARSPKSSTNSFRKVFIFPFGSVGPGMTHKTIVHSSLNLSSRGMFISFVSELPPLSTCTCN